MAERVVTAYYQEAILCHGCNIEIAFKISGVCYLFYGRVPCHRCACVPRMSGHSRWIASHVDLLLNGSADFPDIVSAVVIRWTTESFDERADLTVLICARGCVTTC